MDGSNGNAATSASTESRDGMRPVVICAIVVGVIGLFAVLLASYCFFMVCSKRRRQGKRRKHHFTKSSRVNEDKRSSSFYESFYESQLAYSQKDVKQVFETRKIEMEGRNKHTRKAATNPYATSGINQSCRSAHHNNNHHHYHHQKKAVLPELPSANPFKRAGVKKQQALKPKRIPRHLQPVQAIRPLPEYPREAPALPHANPYASNSVHHETPFLSTYGAQHHAVVSENLNPFK